MTQRIIKFRAWDVGKSEMVYDGIEYALRCLKLSEEGEFTCIGFSPSETLNFKIMQFTGLYDKNGVEIYEGDIVKATVGLHYWVYEIKSVGGQFGNMLFALTRKHNVSIDKDSDRYTYEEVVTKSQKRNYIPSGKNVGVLGNIYQNPELLEE